MKYLKRGVKFSLSMAKWYMLGQPLRDPDETKELFESHCLGGDGQPCEFYDPEMQAAPTWPKGGCTKCGCHVSADPDAVLNKVNKPHERCPLMKWLELMTVIDNGTKKPFTVKIGGKVKTVIRKSNS